MSSSQLDDINDQKADEAMANALGITVDEVVELDYNGVETNESSDGLIYNYYIEIQKETSDSEVLEKVMELNDYEDNDEFITIYLDENLFNEPDDDDDYDDDREDDEEPKKQLGGNRTF